MLHIGPWHLALAFSGTGANMSLDFDATDKALISGFVDQRQPGCATRSFTFASSLSTNTPGLQNNMFAWRKNAPSPDVAQRWQTELSGRPAPAAALLLRRAPSCAVSSRSYF